MKATVEAQKQMDWLKEYTINWPEIENRLETMLERREAEMVTLELIIYVMRNLGKAEGKEIPVGQESKPMPDLGYPDGWTRMVGR